MPRGRIGISVSARTKRTALGTVYHSGQRVQIKRWARKYYDYFYHWEWRPRSRRSRRTMQMQMTVDDRSSLRYSKLATRAIEPNNSTILWIRRTESLRPSWSVGGTNGCWQSANLRRSSSKCRRDNGRR